MVERGPEKAGVGGSIPSLATNTFNNLAIAKNIQKSSRVQYANIEHFIFAVAQIIEPSINHVPVLDGSYKQPNGQPHCVEMADSPLT